MIIFSFCTINFNNSPCEPIFHKNAEGSFWLGKTFPFKIIFRKEKNLQNSDLIHTVIFSLKQGRRGAMLYAFPHFYCPYAFYLSWWQLTQSGNGFQILTVKPLIQIKLCMEMWCVNQVEGQPVGCGLEVGSRK